MKRPGEIRSAALMATFGASVIMAHQLAARAARDYFFLASFRAHSLPMLTFFVAVFSLALVAFTSRAMAAKGPERLVPAAFAGSALLHLAEWGLSFGFRKVLAVVLYLHFSALGLVLISGFWSIVTERFDPHTARKRIAGIASGAAVGSLAGGAMQWAIGAFSDDSYSLLLLCGLHLTAAWIVRGLRSPAALPRTVTSTTGNLKAGVNLMRQHPYLRYLAWLVFVGAAGTTLVNFVFIRRLEAADVDRLPFLALFCTGANLVNFVIQISITKPILERRGLGETAATHPAMLAIGSMVAVGVPGMGGAVFVRGSEQVVRNSLFRSAYELFFTPLKPEEKRCTKPLIDVGVERLGDIAGAFAGYCVPVLGAAAIQPAMLALAAVAGLVGLWITRRLDRGYVTELERSLKDRAVELELGDVIDHTTRMTVFRTRAGLAARVDAKPSGHHSPAPRTWRDPLQRRIAELRCGDAPRVRRALNDNGMPPELTPHAVALLAWDEVSEDAIRALRHAGPGLTGQLVEALCDESTDFVIRRRLPRVLAGMPSAQACAGLTAGLADKRFEVRYRCGRALLAIQSQNRGLALTEEHVYRAVCRELEVDRHLWESHRLLDAGEEEQMIGDRANRGLEHVFTLLSLVLPKDPLRISFYALHTRDDMLRGTALEYLDSILPPDVRERLWPFVEEKPSTRQASRTRDQVLAALMESHASIQERLLEMRAKEGAER